MNNALMLLALFAVSGFVLGNPSEPNADFEWHQEGLTVHFKDNTTNQLNIVAWYWDFGDGQTSTEQNPTHTYPAYGNYTVFFTVWTSTGFSNTEKKVIWVKEQPKDESSIAFWIALLIVFAGIIIVFFGGYPYVRIAGAVIAFTGTLIFYFNQITIEVPIHTENMFVRFGIPIMLLTAFIGSLAVTKNVTIRMALALMFFLSVAILA